MSERTSKTNHVGSIAPPNRGCEHWHPTGLLAEAGFKRHHAGADGPCLWCEIDRLRAENERLVARLATWQASCTGKHGSQMSCVNSGTDETRAATDEVLEEKYLELIFAVGNKYPGETRHQTALRYIRQAELGDQTKCVGAEVKANARQPCIRGNGDCPAGCCGESR